MCDAVSVQAMFIYSGECVHVPLASNPHFVEVMFEPDLQHRCALRCEYVANFCDQVKTQWTQVFRSALKPHVVQLGINAASNDTCV